MTTEVIISTFSKLGELMRAVGKGGVWPGFQSGITEDEYNALIDTVHSVRHKNNWFTENYVRMAFECWGHLLTEEILSEWVSNYKVGECSKKVGIIMAGNLPLVGFHDLLSVAISNQIALVKMSSEDNQLIPMLLQILFNYCPGLKERIHLVDVLEGFDAVIATGSNNSSRYFEAYFNHVPNIIRKNRTSIGIVKLKSTDDEIHNLGKDIFSYYGLGCRSVTKVFFEQGFDLDRFFKGIYSYNSVANMNKYVNNYEYHKALFLMNSEKFLDNGFLILRENKDDFSPIGVLHYEYYSSEESLTEELEMRKEHIQCIVSDQHVPYGKSQAPRIDEYADGVDTLEFLTELR